MKNDFLVEIGIEELPAQGLEKLSLAFKQKLEEKLNEVDLSYAKAQAFTTPRRLAVIVYGLDTQQPDKTIHRKGPAVSNAFDESGKPTPSALGFAKSCGVTMEAIRQEETAKGVYLVYKGTQRGKKAAELLPLLVEESLKQLPAKKMMRWGSSDVSFIRPIQWVLLLFGETPIKTTLFNQPTQHLSYGHRFHHPQAVTIKAPLDYEKQLEKAYVIVDFKKRQHQIKQAILKATQPTHGQTIIHEDLLAEVTGLVEWPVALLGRFSEKFLSLPKEVLITTLKNHQKCFPIENEQKMILPYFVLVSNIESVDDEHLILDYARVITARLSDAVFFYEADLKTPLVARVDELKSILFNPSLGSLFVKATRLAKNAQHFATLINANADDAKQAAMLAKTDLMTHMVIEFPELQGVMGGYYARAQQLNPSVCEAIASHYQPRFSKDEVPTSPISVCVALADKLDTLVGIFGIGQAPTGEKDPFALRRAALGVLRIIIENKLDLNLSTLLNTAISSYGDEIKKADLHDLLLDFMLDRLKSFYLEQGVDANTYHAVMGACPSSPLDFHKRIQAIQHFQTLKESNTLAAMNKRVVNLLKKQAFIAERPVDPQLFEHAIEKQLNNEVSKKTKETFKLKQQREYVSILTTLIDLEPLMNQYFDKVLVMAEDHTIRENRLRLLYQIKQLFLQVADISVL